MLISNTIHWSFSYWQARFLTTVMQYVTSLQDSIPVGSTNCQRNVNSPSTLADCPASWSFPEGHVLIIEACHRHLTLSYWLDSMMTTYESYCTRYMVLKTISKLSLIAKFRGPTWGPSGADRTQVCPMLAPWTLFSGMFKRWHEINRVIIASVNDRCQAITWINADFSTLH